MRKRGTIIALAMVTIISSVIFMLLKNPQMVDQNAIPTVSGLRIGMSPEDVQAKLGPPTHAPEGGIWRYRDGTIVAYQGEPRRSLSFATGRSAGLSGGLTFECPVPLASVVEAVGEPHETIDKFRSCEVIFRTRHGILVASSNEWSQVYLFKLSSKYPVRSTPSIEPKH